MIIWFIILFSVLYLFIIDTTKLHPFYNKTIKKFPTILKYNNGIEDYKLEKLYRLTFYFNVMRKISFSFNITYSDSYIHLDISFLMFNFNLDFVYSLSNLGYGDDNDEK